MRSVISWRTPVKPPFAFLEELTALPSSATEVEDRPAPEMAPPRYLYSYFALYGDPLADPDLDPFPDGYLARLAELGVNGVWLQAVLEQAGAVVTCARICRKATRTRLENLRRLVERARRFGIGVYLYLNEPRAHAGVILRATIRTCAARSRTRSTRSARARRRCRTFLRERRLRRVRRSARASPASSPSP